MTQTFGGASNGLAPVTVGGDKVRGREMCTSKTIAILAGVELGNDLSMKKALSIVQRNRRMVNS